MACGVYLGILLVCLVQAEHARCFWPKESQSSQRHNSDRYAGFWQQDSGLRKLGGSYPQNQFRQASLSTGSAQNSSFNKETVFTSGFGQGLYRRGSMQLVSQPAQNEYASAWLVQNSSVSNPDRPLTKWYRLTVPKVQKAQLFNQDTPTSTGRFVHHHGKTQNGHKGKRSWPTQQGTWDPTKYLTSKGAAVRSASKEEYLFTSAFQSTAQRPHGSAGETPAYYGEKGSSSKLFGADAPKATQQFACGLGKRVSANRHSGAFRPFRFLPLNERLRKNPSQTEAGELDQSQGRLSSTSSSKSSDQASWNKRNPSQGAHNWPFSGSRRVGTSAQRFAPTRIHVIPHHLGGYAIRRLKELGERKEVSVLKPQQTYTGLPQQPASYKPQAEKVGWLRLKPRQ